MAESNQQADPSAALEIPSQDQEDFQQNLTKMGMDLERLMEAIKGEQGEIQTRVDTKSGTAKQCKDDISQVFASRVTLTNAQTQWEEASGSKVEDRIAVAIAGYRIRSSTPYHGSPGEVGRTFAHSQCRDHIPG